MRAHICNNEMVLHLTAFQLLLLVTLASVASAATDPFPTHWRVRATDAGARWDLAELQFYSDESCTNQLAVTDATASGTFYSSSSAVGANYVEARAADDDMMTYWAGARDGCGDMWVGVAIEAGHAVRCVRLYQPGYVSPAGEALVEAWSVGKQAWVTAGGVGVELSHCPRSAALCCFEMDGCPVADAIPISYDPRAPPSSHACAPPSAPPSPLPPPPPPPPPLPTYPPDGPASSGGSAAAVAIGGSAEALSATDDALPSYVYPVVGVSVCLCLSCLLGLCLCFCRRRPEEPKELPPAEVAEMGTSTPNFPESSRMSLPRRFSSLIAAWSGRTSTAAAAAPREGQRRSLAKHDSAVEVANMQELQEIQEAPPVEVSEEAGTVADDGDGDGDAPVLQRVSQETADDADEPVFQRVSQVAAKVQKSSVDGGVAPESAAGIARGGQGAPEPTPRTYATRVARAAFSNKEAGVGRRAEDEEAAGDGPALESMESNVSSSSVASAAMRV